ncbi:NAD(P)/FAD-dependent oxidoreductase [Acidisoma silvae]|uniref:NAD(P)/FAD-dependent oxidoreductase n=1 Tax=Acidisoma silvae TaxID=2802396 RepID=A0A963YSH7_9PROT|nr:NAD(P)/FAD-dependent oxidoreductase [Acidisoma silvae]MCB8876244.1 NAD(P)/FAD-dependent oxidoreductase [Acidisoma silvae]
MPAKGKPYQLVIVGGGVAGIEIATSLGRKWRGARRRGQSAPEITLVDADFAHVWKPILHTIAAGTRDVAQQNLAFVLQARDAGFAYQPGALTGLDRAAKEIVVAPLMAPDGRTVIPERRIAYDTLVLAIGSEANDFGTPGVKDHCRFIDSRRQAIAFNHEVRTRMLQAVAFEQPLSIAIVGGGATGVELAAELIQLLDISTGLGAKGLAGLMTVTLMEAGPRLLPAFPEDISAATERRLTSIGIKVMTNAKVAAATETGFTLADGSEVTAGLKVWAAGVKAPGLLASLDGLETGRNNQLRIEPNLATTRDPSIFAVGDCASLQPAGASHPLPPTAQVAHQQAHHLVTYLPYWIASGRPPPPFHNKDMGAIVSLSEYDAFASLGRLGLFRGVTFRGRLAQFSHEMLYRGHQQKIFGFWRGGIVWFLDWLNARVRAPVKLD